MTFGRRIAEERRRLKMTLVDFAAIGGVAKTTQTLYEANKRTPGLDYLSALSLHGVDQIYVLTGHRADQRSEFDEPVLGYTYAVFSYESAKRGARKIESVEQFAEILALHLQVSPTTKTEVLNLLYSANPPTRKSSG